MRLPYTKERDGSDDRKGVTSIEYALLAAMIAMTIIVSVIVLGQTVKIEFYDAIVNAVSS